MAAKSSATERVRRRRSKLRGFGMLDNGWLIRRWCFSKSSRSARCGSAELTAERRLVRPCIDIIYGFKPRPVAESSAKERNSYVVAAARSQQERFSVAHGGRPQRPSRGGSSVSLEDGRPLPDLRRCHQLSPSRQQSMDRNGASPRSPLQLRGSAALRSPGCLQPEQDRLSSYRSPQ